MANLSEQEKKVEEVIKRISAIEGIGWSEARTMVHKYVCGGKCSWYKTNSRKTGFNRHNLSEKHKTLIEETVKHVMKDSTIEEAKWQIHGILCPGHPRPRPERNNS